MVMASWLKRVAYTFRINWKKNHVRSSRYHFCHYANPKYYLGSDLFGGERGAESVRHNNLDTSTFSVVVFAHDVCQILVNLGTLDFGSTCSKWPVFPPFSLWRLVSEVFALEMSHSRMKLSMSIQKRANSFEIPPDWTSNTTLSRSFPGNQLSHSSGCQQIS